MNQEQRSLKSRIGEWLSFIIITPAVYGFLLGTWEFTGLFACFGALFSVFFQITRDWIVET